MKVDRIPVSGHGASVKVAKGRPGGANGVAVAAALANGAGNGTHSSGGHRRRMTSYRRPHPIRRRIMSSAGPIQRLFEACKHVFKGPGTIPSAEDVKALRYILDTMTVEDVGLRPDLPFFQPSSSSDDSSEGRSSSPRPAMPRKIIRTIIHNRKNMFELSIFLLPAGAVIPLHNHPGMTVFSKLLLGSLHVKSYDWVDPPADPTPGANSGVPRLAKLKSDCDISAPCSTSVLYPTTGGNMHTFTAITPCVVLDVLGPPYSCEDGRDCSYYTDKPCDNNSCSSSPAGSSCTEKDDICQVGESGEGGECSGVEEDRYALLEEVDEPDDLFDLLFYMGPQVMDA